MDFGMMLSMHVLDSFDHIGQARQLGTKPIMMSSNDMVSQFSHGHSRTIKAMSPRG
jgi:hypothetical protein